MKKVLSMALIICAVAIGIYAQNNSEQIIFEETFSGKLSDGWRWIKEEPADWRIKDDGLEICVRPGNAQSVKNALIRQAPDRNNGKYAIEVTIKNLQPPTNQFEQAGITWYCNGKPVFKLVKELVDGKILIIPGRKPVTNDTTQLRLIVDKNSYIAQYRDNAGGDFLTATSGNLPPPENDEVSIQCYHGSDDDDRWVRFDDFRIIRLSD
ncbi:MAG: hypothetical protein ACP5T0_10940 [Verrucomicrobiia bacterium]